MSQFNILFHISFLIDIFGFRIGESVNKFLKISKLASTTVKSNKISDNRWTVMAVEMKIGPHGSPAGVR